MLSNFISQTIYDGKSVTANNKKLIATAAAEIKQSLELLPTLTEELTPTPPQPPPPTQSTENLKKEIIDAVRQEMASFKKQFSPTPHQSHQTPHTLSYAQAASRTTPYTQNQHAPPPLPTTKPNYSIIVTANTANDTGTEAVEMVRSALQARTNGLQIEKIRKARDSKVVLSCASKTEITKVTNQLNKTTGLTVKEAKYKNPLVILKDLLTYNTDDDIKTALAEQNKHLLQGLTKEETNIDIKYRRRARNALRNHVVLSVSPKMWQILTKAGTIFIDVQKIRVEDQSPLVQCTKCLAHGHGRKYCQEEDISCNYCGDKHTRSECPKATNNEHLTCKNCKTAKIEDNKHSVFSNTCPIRRKWDALARGATQYC